MNKKVKKIKPVKEPRCNVFFWVTESQAQTLKALAAKNGRSLRKEIVSRLNGILDSTEIPDKPAEMLEKLQIQISKSANDKIIELAKHELLSARRKLTDLVLESLK